MGIQSFQMHASADDIKKSDRSRVASHKTQPQGGLALCNHARAVRRIAQIEAQMLDSSQEEKDCVGEMKQKKAFGDGFSFLYRG
jgi:hypothetical protein